MDKNPSNSIKILVTAGPTREPIDPVRYISNLSSGMMGYEIATECEKRGFDVCLISGPVEISPPKGVDTIYVTTASEMRDKVNEQIESSGCIIMTAAVCDFRPDKIKEQKIKEDESLTLKLVKNPDILKGIENNKDLVKVGFALETENAVENAKKKIKEKFLDLIVLNEKTESNEPFGPGEKRARILDNKGNIKEFNKVTKPELARVLIDEIEGLL